MQQLPSKHSSITLAQTQFKQLGIRILRVHLTLVILAMFDWTITLELLGKRYSLILSLALVHIWLLLKNLAQQKMIHFFILAFFCCLASWAGSQQDQIRSRSWNITTLMGLLSRNQGAKRILFFSYCNRNSPAKLKLGVICISSPSLTLFSLKKQMTQLTQKALHLEESWEAELFHSTAGVSISITSTLSLLPLLLYYTITATVEESYPYQSSLNQTSL